MVFVQFFIFLKISFLSRSRTRSRLGSFKSRLGKPRFQNDRDPESIVLDTFNPSQEKFQQSHNPIIQLSFSSPQFSTTKNSKIQGF
jgi:hypothetical protein